MLLPWLRQAPRFLLRIFDFQSRFRRRTAPLLAEPSVRLSSDQLASRPASVGVASSTAPGCYYDWWDDCHAWSHHSTAVVAATVVAVATTAAIRATVKARSTATSNWNCHTRLSLFERREG